MINWSDANFTENQPTVYMKRFKLVFVTLAMLLSFYAVPAVAQSVYILPVIKVPSTLDHEKIDLPEYGKRIPSCPIECTISQDTGVTIYDCPDEIVSYEIWDADGNSCLSLCSDESDFLSGLFSMTGDFQIRLKTSDYTYIGYLSTSDINL